MSLMSRIGRKLVAAPKPKPETQLRVAINARNAEANPPFKPSPVHPGKADINDPKPSPPPPRAKSVETRQRMSESQKRRYATSDPVPTSAQLTSERLDAANDRAAEIFLAAAELSTPAGIAKQLTRIITPPKPAAPRVTPPSLPPVPPRAELELDLVKRLEALPLPAPPPEAPPPVSTGFRGSCKAINPDTGRQCALLAGHTKLHRHGSTEFRFGAAPGTTSFRRRELLDAHASQRPDSPFTTT